MMNFIREKLKWGMWVIAIAFVGGLFFVGGRSVGPLDSGSASRSKATVGGI